MPKSGLAPSQVGLVAGKLSFSHDQAWSAVCIQREQRKKSGLMALSQGVSSATVNLVKAGKMQQPHGLPLIQ